MKRTFPRALLCLLLALTVLLLPACGGEPADSSATPDSTTTTTVATNDSIDDSTTTSAGDATTGTTDLGAPDASGTTDGTTTGTNGSSAAPTGSTNSGATTTRNQSSTTSKTTQTTKTTTKPTGLNTADSDDIKGEKYDVKKDAFYEQGNYYISWVNTWYSSIETWFPRDEQSPYTAKLKVNGEYITPDQNKPEVRKEIFKQAKEAGVDALFMDSTNGLRWTEFSKDYQRMCYENNMKFGMAVHPRINNGDSNIESICQYVWTNFVELGKSDYSPAYFYKEGKPLLVLYCTWDEFVAATKATSDYASRFTFTWASGENSKVDKWGWQLEPQDGPQLSSDSMFVTCSISWNSPYGSKDSWRKSLAWLDFNFLAAKEAKPQYTIVGMIDDTHERNGWMKMDTTNVVFTIPEIGDNTVPTICHALQMRDIYGNISEDAYYNRVKSWINGTVKPYHTGGPIADGAYTIVNVDNGRMFGTERPAVGANRIPSTDVGGLFYRNTYYSTMETYYWFYYLGNNEYRVIKLTSGLSLQPKGNKLAQYYEDAIEEQRWVLKKTADGSYQIINKKTGQAICDTKGDILLTAANTGDKTQLWKIEPVANRTFG